MRVLYKVWMIFTVLILFPIMGCAPATDASNALSEWETLETIGSPTARHEASFVSYKDKLYLIGGRRINPVDVYDPTTNSWTAKSKTPIELHHFQSVVIGDKIYLMGAMTGQWPTETPLDKIIVYHPEEDRFETTDTIPEARRRGSAGVAVRDGKIYMVGGITNGHMNGYVNWFDEYDPQTGKWRILPDAPQARDHFSAEIIDDKLYAFAGRKSEHAIGNNFGQTLKFGDVFNFKTNRWETTTPDLELPTRRAGNMVMSWRNELIIGGGESDTQEAAHAELDAYDLVSKTWRKWPSLAQGRHGSAFAIIGDYAYVASGCAKRGGRPELATLERLRLPTAEYIAKTTDVVLEKEVKAAAPHRLWHPVTLDFNGPDTSETANNNPFQNFRLFVEFTNGDTRYLVRGFYAADGDAANTSATSGDVWRVRFTPDSIGEWRYKATLRTAANIALSDNETAGRPVDITNSSGSFTVIESDKITPDFRASERGFLKTHAGFFQFEKSKKYWLKGGPNSPENLLAYTDFDATYRLKEEARDGEAAATGSIHSFEPHLADWTEGDPTWADGKGKSIIGAMNYISEQGMNAVYFLTLNITGDGNDVWPYEAPTDFTRFDVSKLEQWNILFNHMQAKGILLHVVLQETENELMLDGGDMGPQRSLYFNELIARFAHHPALIWNLGEENGPVHWRPEGQNDAQRKAMASFLKKHDPYDHPVLLHTHAQASEKDDIAAPLLGFKALDGLSFQVDERETVYSETVKWRQQAKEAGHDWLITMDEIGPWYMGAATDVLSNGHNALRRHVLWGHLLGGGGGVEWYFGARYPSTDLSSEDWRLREQLWTQTRHALTFFETHLPYWEMKPCPGVMDRDDVYCAGKTGEVYAFYMPEGGSGFVGLPKDSRYSLSWFDPKKGGELQMGAIDTIEGSDRVEVGLPPVSNGEDWVLLIQRLTD